MNKEAFKNNLKYYQEKLKMTQRDIAEGTNSAVSSVNAWINGQSIPRIDRVKSLAELFGVEISDLLKDVNDEELCLTELNHDEQVLMSNFRILNDEGKAEALKMMTLLITAYKKVQ